VGAVAKISLVLTLFSSYLTATFLDSFAQSSSTQSQHADTSGPGTKGDSTVRVEADSMGPIASASSVLCAPARATTRVQVEVIHATMENDLREYLDESILPLLRANWYQLISNSGEKTTGDATVQFTILKNGSAAAVQLTDGAGHDALGEIAQRAVANSSPFPPLESGRQSVDLLARFEYEPGTNVAHGAPTAAMSQESRRPAAYTHTCSTEETASQSVDCLTPPRAIFNPTPEFTPEARKHGTQGTVMVSALVAADGTVQNACALQPLGDGLEEKAVEAVRTWKFKPATLNGDPKATQIEVEIDFHLYRKMEPLNLPPPVIVPK
jgi:TonB family protein